MADPESLDAEIVDPESLDAEIVAPPAPQAPSGLPSWYTSTFGPENPLRRGVRSVEESVRQGFPMMTDIETSYEMLKDAAEAAPDALNPLNWLEAVSLYNLARKKAQMGISLTEAEQARVDENRKRMRFTWQYVFPMLVSVGVKGRIPPSAYQMTQMSRLRAFMDPFLGPMRMLLTGAVGSGTGAYMANYFDPDPKRYSDPLMEALFGGTGELLGGTVLPAALRSIGNALVPEPARKEILDYMAKNYPDVVLPLGFQTGSKSLRSTEYHLQNAPIVSRGIRSRYDVAQQALEHDLRMLESSMPSGSAPPTGWSLVRQEVDPWGMTPHGGRVGQETTRLVDEAMRDFGVQAPGGETIPQVRRLGGEVEAFNVGMFPASAQQALRTAKQYRASQGLPAFSPREEQVFLEDHVLAEVPKTLLSGVHRSLDNAKARLNQVYQHLYSRMQQTPMDIAKVQQVRNITLPMLGNASTDSVYHNVFNQIRALKLLPDKVTFNTVEDLYSQMHALRLDVAQAITEKLGPDPVTGQLMTTTAGAKDLQDRIMPRVNQMMKPLEELLHGKMVDLKWVQDKALADLAIYGRGSKVPLVSLEQGVPVPRRGETLDPDIAWLAALVRQPRYVSFDQAQALRSQAGILKRHEGSNIGNRMAERGEEYSEYLKNSMGETANKLGSGPTGLYQSWRAADALYADAARVWNSPLMQDVTSMSPDDFLTRIVMNERPGDTAMLRSVAPAEAWRQVGPMWLTRQIRAAQDPVTGALRPEMLERTIHALTKATQSDAFAGRDLTPLKTALDKATAMQRALTVSDPGELRELARVIGDPALMAAVRSDRLSKVLAGTQDVATNLTQAGKLAARLGEIPPAERDILFPGGELQVLRARLGQADALQQSAREMDPTRLTQLMNEVKDPALKRAVQEDWFTRELAPYFHAEGRVDLNGLYTRMNELRAQPAFRQALFPAGELDRLITQVDVAHALSKAPRAADVGELGNFKARVTAVDPNLWRVAESDWLAQGFFRTDQKSGLLDGAHMMAYLDKDKHFTTMMLGQDGERELRHLAATVKALEDRPGRGGALARITPWGIAFAGMYAFGPTQAAAGVGLVGLGGGTLSWLLSHPQATRAIAHALHTPAESPMAGEIMGLLTGILAGDVLSSGRQLKVTPPPGLPAPTPAR